MRDGRRKRLGLAEGTENPNDGLSYLDNILSDADVAGQPNILNLDTDANVRTTDQDYVSDAYNYYLGGGSPQEEVEAPVVAPDFIGGELIDTSGQDQATSGLGLGDTTITGGTNLNDYAGMGDMTGGVTNDNITVENIAQNQTPYDVPMDPSNPGASIENIIAQQNQTIPDDPSIDAFDINEVGDPSQNPGSINVGDQPMAAGPFDYLQEPSISTIANPEIFDDYAGVNDPQVGDPGFENYISSTSIPDETLSTSISDIFTSAKDLGLSAIETAQELVDKGIGTYNEINKTVTVPGLGEIDIGKTLGGLALNTAFNAPISLAMYAMQQIPKSQSQIDYDNFSDEKKAAVDSIYGPGGVMQDYNAVSGFGKGVDETIQGRIDDFQKNYTTEELEVMAARVNKVTGKPEGNYAKLIDAKEKTGGTGINPNDQLDIDNQINLEKELDDPPAYDDFPEDEDLVTVEEISPGYSPDDDDPADDGPSTYDAEAEDDQYEAPSAPEADHSIPDEYDEPDYDPGPFDYQVQPTYQPGTTTRPGSGGGDGGGSSGCFIKGTLITMADKTTKPVEQVDLGDEVAVGGKVFAVGRFLNTELYDYKGIKVSGSHMVNEEGTWMRVRDTKHGKSLGDDQNTVYVFGSENRRILINDILFTDYFEVNEQDMLMEDSENFFKNWKSYDKKIDLDNVDTLNAS